MQRITRAILAHGLGLAAGCALTPTATFAQAADTPQIVVTAARFAETDAGPAAGVRILSRADIDASGASSIADALVRLGGVHIRNLAGDSNVQIDLRGYGISGDQNTLLLLDGVRISENEQTPTALSAIPLDSVARIELLPGAGAVLYGGGASAGTINIITRTGEANAGRLALASGGFATHNADAQLDLADDGLTLALFAGAHESDNYRRNSESRERTLRGTLTRALPSGALTLRFGHATQDTGLPGVLTRAQIADNPRQSVNLHDNARRDNDDYGLSLRHAPGAVELVVDANWRVRQFDSLSPSFADGARNDTTAHTRTLSPRLRLPYTLAGLPASVVLGVDLSDWDYRRRLDLPGFFFNSDVRATQTDRAFYAQTQLAFAAATHLSLGARAQRSEIDSRDSGTLPNAPPQATQNLRAFDLALRHGLTDNWALSARWAQSFRTANVDDNGFTASGALLKAQTAHDADIGLHFAQGPYSGSATLFQSLLKHEIHFLAAPFIGAGFGFFNGANTNLDPTVHRGLELDAAAQLNPALKLSAAYRYTEARFRRGSVDGFSLAGNDIPLVPRQRLNLGATLMLDAATQLYASARHVGAQRFDNDQVNRAPRLAGYTVVDLKLQHRVSAWTFFIQADNLFDERYLSYGIIPDPSVDSYSGIPEAGRRLLLGAQWRG